LTAPDINHCGKRSAHDKLGGWTVYRNASDITKVIIDAYRISQGK
jgi:hypothetical protein